MQKKTPKSIIKKYQHKFPKVYYDPNINATTSDIYKEYLKE